MRPPRTARGPDSWLIWLPILLAAAFIVGQSGIPVEDGGEIETVAALGGVNHPPGMPLLSLLSRFFWILAPGLGIRILFGATAAVAMLLLLREYAGLHSRFLALVVLMMPAFQERVLAWDAYGPLFLALAASLMLGRISCRRRRWLLGGYLSGLALAFHLQGLLVLLAVLVMHSSREWRSILITLGGLFLGLSTYVLLPVSSAAGAVVDWGSTGSAARFIRQVSAAGYREVYTAIGSFSLEPVRLHLLTVWRLIWPGLLVPLLALVASRIPALRERLCRRREGVGELLSGRAALALSGMIALDLVFVALVNPMAAGTSQTGTATLLVLVVLALEGIRRLHGLAGSVAVLASLLLLLPPRSGLPDQRETIESVLSGCPPRTALVLSDNDLLYGCWSACYARDFRPDVVLLSTGNFSGWFEDLVNHFQPDFDLSTSVMDVGGRDLPREVLAGRLIEAAMDSNPRYTFLSDR